MNITFKWLLFNGSTFYDIQSNIDKILRLTKNRNIVKRSLPGIKYIECNIQNIENIQLNVGRWYSNLGKLVMIFVVCLVWLNYDKQGLSVRYNMSFKVHDLQKAALLQLSHNLLSFQFDNKVAVTFSLHYKVFWIKSMSFDIGMMIYRYTLKRLQFNN